MLNIFAKLKEFFPYEFIKRGIHENDWSFLFHLEKEQYLSIIFSLIIAYFFLKFAFWILNLIIFKLIKLAGLLATVMFLIKAAQSK